MDRAITGRVQREGLLRKWWRLDATDRRLLWEAWIAVARARLLLAVVGFDRTPRRERHSALTLPPGNPDRLIRRVVWATGAAARRVPGAACLETALATRWLLQRRGIETDLRFGVEADSPGLRAHAWVEREGEPLPGATDPITRYRPLHGPG